MKQVKYISVFFLLVFLNQTGKGQTNQLVVKGGGKGVFIFLSDHWSAAAASYMIERSPSKEQAFQQIAAIRSPVDFNSFQANFREAKNANPFFEDVDDKKLELIWNRIQRHPDSASNYLTSLRLQMAAGLVYFDGRAEKNSQYIYRVTGVNETSSTRWQKTSMPVSYPEKIVASSFIFSGYSFSAPQQCTITWKTKGDINPARFILMRSDKQNEPLHLIHSFAIQNSERDSTIITTVDDAAAAGNSFVYQLMVADAFGNITDTTAQHQVITYDFSRVPLPGNIFTTSFDSANERGIKISWSLRDTRYIHSIRIYRSQSEGGKYKLYSELPAGTNSFTDQFVDPAVFYYYHLSLIGLRGEESLPTINYSGVYYTKSKPGTPAILSYQASKNGISLRFYSNDKDVIGYRVYRSEGFHGLMQQVSEFIPASDSVTHFTDNSSVLSGKLTYGYAVKAENSSHIISAFSDTIYARPLKITIPPTPINVSLVSTGSGNMIYWQNMLAMEQTVVGYNIFRAVRSGNAAPQKFEKINRQIIKASSNNYMDSLADKKETYSYYIQTVDGFGGISAASETVSSRNAPSAAVAEVPAPLSLNGYFVTEGIQLEWLPVNFPSLSSFKLYRYQRGEKPLLITTVKKENPLLFVDKTAVPGNLYFYYLVAITKTGAVGKKGNEISIRVSK